MGIPFLSKKPQKEKFELTEEQRQRLYQIELFPGSQEEYESFRKTKVEIMDNGRQDKRVYFVPVWLRKEYHDGSGGFVEFHLKEMLRLADRGCTALIRYHKDTDYDCPYGIPVTAEKRIIQA